MALFQSDLAETIKKLANKTFATPEERDELLGRVEGAEGLRARDVAWMLFRPDRALRDSGARMLGKLRDPETVDAFLAESRNKPEQAMRAAAAALFALPLSGMDARIAQFLAPPQKETKETVELQAAARRLLLEAPVTGGIEQ
jgi:hypothetical protein